LQSLLGWSDVPCDDIEENVREEEKGNEVKDEKGNDTKDEKNSEGKDENENEKDKDGSKENEKERMRGDEKIIALLKQATFMESRETLYYSRSILHSLFSILSSSSLRVAREAYASLVFILSRLTNWTNRSFNIFFFLTFFFFFKNNFQSCRSAIW
jgi:hypothetical protein